MAGSRACSNLPATGWLRRYRVRALGRVLQPALDRLRHGITIDGVRYGAIEATLDREQGSNVWLTFAMREGKNREVKNVLGHLGLKVNRLIRVSFGPFQLTGLEEGAIEEVKTRVLREQLGERVVGAVRRGFFRAGAGTKQCRKRHAFTVTLRRERSSPPRAIARRATARRPVGDHPSRRACGAHLRMTAEKLVRDR